MAFEKQFTADMLREADIESVVTDACCVDVQGFETEFSDAAKSCEASGRSDAALVFRLFVALVSFHFVPADKTEPFSNMVGFADGTRTLVGSDLDQIDISALREIVDTLQVPALKTRIADLVWSQRKSEFTCARIAIEGYAQMVNMLLSGDATLRFEEANPTSVSAQDFLQRGLLIARSTGWNRPENDAIKLAALNVLQEAFDEGGIALVRFGRLAHDAGVGEAKALLARIPEKVEAALEQSDFHAAEELQKLYIEFSLRGQAEKSDPSLYLKLASILEAQADNSETAFLKTHALQMAIDSLHGAQGVREERQRLHGKLKDAQLHLHDEFTPISHSISLQDEVDGILNGFNDLDLLDSIKRPAFTELPKDPAALYAKARDEMKRYPLSSLFSSSTVDDKGRVIARSEGGGGESEDAVRRKILQHQEIEISIAVEAAIRPIRQRITESHRVGLSLLTELCRLSPFVTSGHEHITARGLQAFLYGDDQVAATCLVPTLESGLRQLVSAAGHADTTISTGGIEQTIGLGLMLSNHREVLARVFGERMIFAIENIFVHPLGPKVRHSICHGLASDMYFYSSTYIYSCKLIFSLVILPLAGGDWAKVKERVQEAEHI
jgi:hypothetical protein